jgi:hypothetical protein
MWIIDYYYNGKDIEKCPKSNYHMKQGSNLKQKGWKRKVKGD